MAPDEWQAELRSRRDAFAAILERAGCDLVFGTLGRAEHVRYLTGFAPGMGDAWVVVQAEDDLSGFLDFNWQVDDARRRSGFEWEAEFTAAPLITEALRAEQPRRVGVAWLDRVPAGAYESIRSGIPDAELVEVGAELARLRRRKSPLEVRLLREAARRTDRALDAARQEGMPA